MEKLQNNKILYSNNRIICNDKGVAFVKLNVHIQTYIGTVSHLKNIPMLNFNHNRFNDSIHFELFDLKLSVIELFKIYNSSAKRQGLKTFSKLYYDPKNSIKISPSQIS